MGKAGGCPILVLHKLPSRCSSDWQDIPTSVSRLLTTLVATPEEQGGRAAQACQHQGASTTQAKHKPHTLRYSASWCTVSASARLARSIRLPGATPVASHCRTRAAAATWVKGC